MSSLQQEMQSMTVEALRSALLTLASEGVVVIVREPSYEMRRKLWLTSDEVEAEYGIPSGTLRNWRASKIGPRYTKSGREVRYNRADMDAFMLGNMVLTSDQGALK